MGTFAPSGPLVAVHAHPDDETLSMGGLLATWAASGERAFVVTCTRGERGETIGDDLASLEANAAALAAHRERELAEALAALGVTGHSFLDEIPCPTLDSSLVPPAGSASLVNSPTLLARNYEDSGMEWVAGSRGIAAAASEIPAAAFVQVPIDEAAARLATYLLGIRPSVVATYEPGGGYGHPDHVRTHEVTMRALELCALEGGTSERGAGAFRPAHVWLRVQRPDDYAAGIAEILGNPGILSGGDSQVPLGGERRGHRQQLRMPPALGTGDLPSQVASELSVDVDFPVRPVLSSVVNAMHAYRSQVQAVVQYPRDSESVVASYALSNGELAAIGPYESYHEVRLDW